jgi:hypothetical protein
MAWPATIASSSPSPAAGSIGRESVAGSAREESHACSLLSFDGSAEHAESYIRTALSIIGNDHPGFGVTKGFACEEENKARALTSALDAARQLAARLRELWATKAPNGIYIYPIWLKRRAAELGWLFAPNFVTQVPGLVMETDQEPGFLSLALETDAW